MPWTAEDAPRHNKDAKTKRLKEVWARVANQTLADTDDEGRAVRIANHAVRQAKKSWPVLRHLLRNLPAGNIVDKKMNKKEANYHERSIDMLKCKGCMMFRRPDACKLVEGEINPDGWCEHYLSDTQHHSSFEFGTPS